MLFECIPVFYATKLKIASKTHYFSKEGKYVKKGIFCVLCTKLRNAGKTLYILKRLI
ncbi:hypothetical protein E2C01_042213 [Portunus trituberculatus]|uniref:Uncharacterized protein n=1 Tax=Portunus trituberculatus TaxID=210409 RepID=A0A5B7FL67_PORTR|nr:hypothetical protein [Portunus trituberculatus]